MSKKNPEKFHALAKAGVVKVFTSACKGDRESIREAMMQFAEIHVITEQHAQLRELPPEKLEEIVTNMAVKNPQVFGEFIALIKAAVERLESED